MSELRKEREAKREHYRTEARALIVRMMRKRNATEKPCIDVKDWLRTPEGEALINSFSFLLQDCDEDAAVKHVAHDGIRRIR